MALYGTTNCSTDVLNTEQTMSKPLVDPGCKTVVTMANYYKAYG